MVFKRRNKLTRTQRLREYFWPKSGYRRTGVYLWHRLSRLQASPHAIAVGFACGTFISFTPFIGLHLLLAGLIAWAFRGHILSALIGTAVGNPLTFPFIWAWIYEAGNILLGRGHGAAPIDTSEVSETLLAGFQQAWEIFWPMLVGGVPTGVTVALLCYFPLKFGVERYQELRRARFAARLLPDEPCSQDHEVRS